MEKPELNTVLSNIGSLVEEAKMMTGNEPLEPGKKPGEAEMSPEVAKSVLKWLQKSDGPAKDEDEDEDLKKAKDEDEDEDLKKAEDEDEDEDDDELGKSDDEDEDEDVDKSDEGTNASDDAEEVVNDLGDINDKNIDAVAKAIVKSLMGGKSSKRTVQKTSKGNLKLRKSLESVRAENHEIKKALSNILEGMGIAEQVKIQETELKKSMEARKVPNDSQDLQKTLDFLKTALGVRGNSDVAAPDNGNNSLRKSLTDNNGLGLASIFAINAKNTLKK